MKGCCCIRQQPAQLVHSITHLYQLPAAQRQQQQQQQQQQPRVCHSIM